MIDIKVNQDFKLDYNNEIVHTEPNDTNTSDFESASNNRTKAISDLTSISNMKSPNINNNTGFGISRKKSFDTNKSKSSGKSKKTFNQVSIKKDGFSRLNLEMLAEQSTIKRKARMGKIYNEWVDDNENCDKQEDFLDMIDHDFTTNQGNFKTCPLQCEEQDFSQISRKSELEILSKKVTQGQDDDEHHPTNYKTLGCYNYDNSEGNCYNSLPADTPAKDTKVHKQNLWQMKSSIDSNQNSGSCIGKAISGNGIGGGNINMRSIDTFQYTTLNNSVRQGEKTMVTTTNTKSEVGVNNKLEKESSSHNLSKNYDECILNDKNCSYNLSSGDSTNKKVNLSRYQSPPANLSKYMEDLEPVKEEASISLIYQEIEGQTFTTTSYANIIDDCPTKQNSNSPVSEIEKRVEEYADFEEFELLKRRPDITRRL